MLQNHYSQWEDKISISQFLVPFVIISLLFNALPWNHSFQPGMNQNVQSKQAASADEEYPIEYVGALIGGKFSAVTVEDSYAYAGIGNSLAVLDISDPQKFTMLGSVRPVGDTDFGLVDISKSQSRIYVTGNRIFRLSM